MIKSPKEKFQQSQIRTGQWAQALAQPVFDEAIDSSLLQMLSVMPDSVESHYRMAGAQQLVRILKTIHEHPENQKEKIPQGLNYQAGV